MKDELFIITLYSSQLCITGAAISNATRFNLAQCLKGSVHGLPGLRQENHGRKVWGSKAALFMVTRKQGLGTMTETGERTMVTPPEPRHTQSVLDETPGRFLVQSNGD